MKSEMQNDQTSKNHHIFEGNQHERYQTQQNYSEKTINRSKRLKNIYN